MLNRCYCQPLDPANWHEQEHLWEQFRFFYCVTTRMAFHNPLTYNEDTSRAMIQAKVKGYIIKPNSLILVKSGLFRGEIFLEVQPPQGVQNTSQAPPCLQLQGRFYTSVSDAPWHQMGTAVDKFLQKLKKQEKKIKDFYLCLATCPLCIREKGYQTILMAHLWPT